MNTIPIGIVVNTHGLRGTLKVKSFTDFKSIRYQKGNVLYIAFRDQLIPVTVDKYRTVKGLDYIDFIEFDNINQCEQYKGSDLVMNKEDVHELDDDEFYYDDLIGMSVIGDTFRGVVTAVREVPRGELLVVKVDEKEVLIPFLDAFIDSVDKATKTIYVKEWEGLV